uniref:Putative homeobox transcription factor sip1 n=1 Tax=Ixodes ricinus TaxID=34613 RepID=A0A6B0USS5_IXORI
MLLCRDLDPKIDAHFVIAQTSLATYCKRLIFCRLNISRFRSKLKFWSNSQVLFFAMRWDLNIDSNVFTFYRNHSRDLFFANCRRFAKFAKIGSFTVNSVLKIYFFFLEKRLFCEIHVSGHLKRKTIFRGVWYVFS